MLVMLTALSADALVTEVVGPQPDAAAQSWWPEGVEILARHPSRVYARQYDAVETIYFMAGPAAMATLLNAFAAIDCEEHPVTRHAETAHARDFEGKEYAYTIRLDIPDPGMAKLRFPHKPAPPPHMTIYLEESARLTLPKGLRLTREVAAYRAAPSTDSTTAKEENGDTTRSKDPQEPSGRAPAKKTGETTPKPKH